MRDVEPIMLVYPWAYPIVNHHQIHLSAVCSKVVWATASVSEPDIYLKLMKKWR